MPSGNARHAPHPPPVAGSPGDETQTLANKGDLGVGAADAAVLGRGACLGRYVVLSALGSGGMGNVYSAYDPELDRKVALKVLRGDLFESQARGEAHSRLLREAQAAAKLAHPNVVAVYDMGTVDERLFVAMELIEGQTLREWLDEKRRSWRDCLRLFREAGEGLAAAHRVGLIHRDLKPSNIMKAADGRARILDFGLARAAGADPEVPAGDDLALGVSESPLTMTLTRGGQMLGTPAYMAPEQYHGTAVDARADQFSFCVALYEALYGEHPFPGETWEELEENVRQGRIREGAAESSVPRWLRPVLVRGLEPDPRERFPSMDDLLAALARDPATRRRRFLGAVMAVIVVAALAVKLWSSWGATSLLCKGADRKLAGIWDERRQSEIQQAFLATGVPYAQSGWNAARESLDSYADAWVATHAAACEATRLRGEQSEEMLDLQMACLDRRLQEMAVVTGALAAADAPVVRSAVQVADGLTSLDGCTDRRGLRAALPPPEDAERAAQVYEIRNRLDAARVRERAGQYAASLEVAEEAVRAADEVDYAPVAAEARALVGSLQGRTGQREQMKDTLLEAARIAHGIGHDELVARAYTILIVAGIVRGQAEDAHVWSRLAAGTIERLGNRRDLAANRYHFLGMLASLEGEFEPAIEYFETSLETHPRPTAFRRSAAFNNIGFAYARLGRLDVAAEYYRDGLKEIESVYGPQHPNVQAVLHNLGNVYVDQSDFKTALQFFQRSLNVAERNQLLDHPEAAYASTGLGESLLGLDRPAEAVSYLERAVGLREANRVDPWELAKSRYQLARALWASGGDRERAKSLALAAHQGWARLGERAKADLKQVEAWLRERGETP